MRLGAVVDVVTGATDDPDAGTGSQHQPNAQAGLTHLKFQIIMVTLLCELGGFLKLCKGKTRVRPLHLLAALLCGCYNR